MRNSPLHAMSTGPLRASGAVAPSQRLALLFVMIVALTTILVGRIAWMQLVSRNDFLEVWDQPTESFEPIPAHDGRIVTADGQVLAYDELSFTLTVHYRWFESPPDPSWLASQVRSRLSTAERRDAARREDMQIEVLQLRDRMHAELASLLHIAPTDLERQFHSVQQQVERIVASVEARRAAKELQETGLTGGPTDTPQPRPEGEPSSSLWDRIVAELTTPPRREGREPVVVAEELAYHPIATRLPIESVGFIESYPSRFPGITIQVDSRRVYPEHDLAPHLVGVRTSITDEEIAQLKHDPPNSSTTSPSTGHPAGLVVGSRIGRGGVERAFDSQLRGTAGIKRTVRNRQGEVLATSIVRPPEDGHDVVLTIDARLQRQAEQLLDLALQSEQGSSTSASSRFDDPAPPSSVDDSVSGAMRPVGGCLVAIDVRTGAVLAAATAPRYDVNLLVSATQGEWDRVASHPGRPFFPRVTHATVPPGSVFKILSAIALTESGQIDPQREFPCRGYLDNSQSHRCALFRRHGIGHGGVDLSDALCQSCNVYFFDGARKIGPQPIETWARRFGLGQTTGFDIAGERTGNVPTSAEATREKPWYPGLTLQMAIGQGELLVTPIQVARMMAAVANDGWLVTPHLFDSSGSNGGIQPVPSDRSSSIQLVGHETSSSSTDAVTAPVPPPMKIDGLSPTTLPSIRDGLQRVVTDPQGTGRLAALEGMTIAGKTGTAEVGNGQPDHAWFAGYAPAESPRVAFVVFLEHGGSGGRAAAPLAKEFVQSLIENQVLAPRR